MASGPKPDEFRITGEEPRERGVFLAPCGRKGDQYGFTDIPAFAMKDEPQALDDDEFQIHVLGRAQTAAQQQAAIEAAKLSQVQRLLSLEERLERTRQDARSRCVDVTRESRLIRMMIDAGKQARHVEVRVVAMERKVYREVAA